jgi:hypothetical protein
MWQSVAKWPFPEVATWSADNTSVDKHDTEAQAQAVVDRLLAEGFGGDRKIFPISAFVRRLDQSFADSVIAAIRADETRPKFVHLPDGSSARADKIESVIVRDSDTSFTGKPMVCVAFRLGGDSVDALHFGCETIEAAKELAEKIAADVEAAEADQ